MSDWALGGLCLALFIAGFNIGQDYKKGFFGRKKQYKYYISGFYSIAGIITFTSWTSEFNGEITSEELKKIKEVEEKKMKDKFKTSDATFGIIYIKKLKD
ncbi:MULTISPECIES: hypothetical protein [Fusobacterium]|jgi:hypothetical protein|uniref:hypothetical protein n=1 Tax=Fusobacterium TaxID=848 RepID=UPI000452F0CE|nr:hypothetical protein [Fusobacterium sp. CM22]EUB28255.1 hypothetical protein HMPREF1500_2313 [Fusobacterium sp. CM22]DAJ58048.1 MAG TPA: Integrin alpha-1 Alpha1, Transmembrane Region, Detergent [Caudoviricetes sp.]